MNSGCTGVSGRAGPRGRMGLRGCKGARGPRGLRGATGPTGIFDLEQTIFQVEGSNDDVVAFTLGDSLIFTSKTLDIQVTEGSAIVNMELNRTPTGSSGPTGQT